MTVSADNVERGTCRATILIDVFDVSATFTVDEVAETGGVHKTTNRRCYPTLELPVAVDIQRLGESAVSPVVDGDPRAAIGHLVRLAASW